MMLKIILPIFVLWCYISMNVDPIFGPQISQSLASGLYYPLTFLYQDNDTIHQIVYHMKQKGKSEMILCNVTKKNDTTPKSWTSPYYTALSRIYTARCSEFGIVIRGLNPQFNETIFVAELYDNTTTKYPSVMFNITSVQAPEPDDSVLEVYGLKIKGPVNKVTKVENFTINLVPNSVQTITKIELCNSINGMCVSSVKGNESDCRISVTASSTLPPADLTVSSSSSTESTTSSTESTTSSTESTTSSTVSSTSSTVSSTSSTVTSEIPLGPSVKSKVPSAKSKVPSANLTSPLKNSTLASTTSTISSANKTLPTTNVTTKGSKKVRRREYEIQYSKIKSNIEDDEESKISISIRDDPVPNPFIPFKIGATIFCVDTSRNIIEVRNATDEITKTILAIYTSDTNENDMDATKITLVDSSGEPISTSPDEQAQQSSGLSGGAIAGIVIAVVAGVGIICAVAYHFVKPKK